MPFIPLLEALLPQLISLGMQEAPVIIAYINSLNQLAEPGRPDIDDATRDAIKEVKAKLLARIDALAAGGTDPGP